MKLWKKLLLIFVILLAVLLTASIAWMSGSTQHAEAIVDPYLTSSAQVRVEDGNWLTFSPSGANPSVGFIFYPGGNVDHKAYAPTLFRIAEAGFLVVDVPMPFDLAVMGANKADKVIAAYPEIETWVIGGHSLGGAMSARYVYSHPGQIDGLALWAAYPADSDSLAGAEIEVLSISGELDGLATPKKIERTKSLLPDSTVYLQIEGGNHAQFGFYGSQSRDLPAEISRAGQQAQIVEAMIEFLGLLED